MRYEVRLSGAGGQGLILAGMILAEAAAIYDGKNAVQSQSYGPEARGGASKSDVIISDGDIDYPKAQDIDALLALTQEACDKYIHELKDDGILLIDSDIVTEIPKGQYKVVKIPITDIAVKEAGKAFVANVVALGAVVQLTDTVSRESVEKALLNRVPRGTEDLNKKALSAGFKNASDATKGG